MTPAPGKSLDPEVCVQSCAFSRLSLRRYASGSIFFPRIHLFRYEAREMLDLHDIAGWRQLKDAYGDADKIPGLLQQLEALPIYTDYKSEPYFSLWSALCHQDDAYTASYAAMPHLVRLAGSNAAKPQSLEVLQLAAAIETARLRGQAPPVPDALRDSYDRAINQIPAVVVEIAKLHRGRDDARIAMTAIAAAMGQGELAYAVIDLLQD